MKDSITERILAVLRCPAVGLSIMSILLKGVISTLFKTTRLRIKLQAGSQCHSCTSDYVGGDGRLFFYGVEHYNEKENADGRGVMVREFPHQ